MSKPSQAPLWRVNQCDCGRLLAAVLTLLGSLGQMHVRVDSHLHPIL